MYSQCHWKIANFQHLYSPVIGTAWLTLFKTSIWRSSVMHIMSKCFIWEVSECWELDEGSGLKESFHENIFFDLFSGNLICQIEWLNHITQIFWNRKVLRKLLFHFQFWKANHFWMERNKLFTLPRQAQPWMPEIQSFHNWLLLYLTHWFANMIIDNCPTRVHLLPQFGPHARDKFPPFDTRHNYTLRYDRNLIKREVDRRVQEARTSEHWNWVWRSTWLPLALSLNEELWELFREISSPRAQFCK